MDKSDLSISPVAPKSEPVEEAKIAAAGKSARVPSGKS
jgi:hypothetical protein